MQPRRLADAFALVAVLSLLGGVQAAGVAWSAGGPSNPDAPSRVEAALQAAVAGYAGSVAYSRVFTTEAGELAAVVYGPSAGASGEAKLDVLAFMAGHFEKRQTLTLASTGYMPPPGGSREADDCSERCIVLAHLESASAADLVVTIPLGVNSWLYVVSLDAGSARLIPFGSGPERRPGVAVTEEPAKALQGDTIVSEVSSCVPNCASGKSVTTAWRYDPAAGAFASLAPSPGRVVPLPLSVPVSKPLTQVIAWLTFPVAVHATAGRFVASVDWGDGTSSSAAVSAEAKLDPLDSALFAASGRTAFAITASHTYHVLTASQFTVTVRRPGQTDVVGNGRVSVIPVNPTALFLFDPGTPTKNDLTLLVPAQPTGVQRPVAAYRWTFGDGTPTVVDSAQTQPLYQHVISELLAHPDDPFLRAQAEAMNILPPGQGGLPAGVLGLSSDQVKQIAGVWQSFYPAHVIPHIYPRTGPVSVTLTVFDTAGASNTLTRLVTVSDQCKTWVLPFNLNSAGYTTCDTARGFSTFVDGPKRAPDYWSIDLSSSFGSLAALKLARIGLSGGIGLVLARDGTVYVTVHAEGGLSAGAGGGVGYALTKGWEGPWDTTQQPANSEIDGFINGLTYPVSASAQLYVYKAAVTLILSPGPPARAGEELLSGKQFSAGASVGITAGVSCSIPIATLPATWHTAEQRLVSALAADPAPAALQPLVQTAVTLLQPELIPAITLALGCIG